jgi:hypothetical protein
LVTLAVSVVAQFGDIGARSASVGSREENGAVPYGFWANAADAIRRAEISFSMAMKLDST